MSILSVPMPRMAVLLFFLVGTICPGLLFLLVFSPTLFNSLDLVRLLGLAGAITFPVFAINAAAMWLAMRPAWPDNERERRLNPEQASAFIAGAACVLSVLPLYTPILWHFFTGCGGIRVGVGITCGMELLVLLFSVYLIVLAEQLEKAERKKAAAKAAQGTAPDGSADTPPPPRATVTRDG